MDCCEAESTTPDHCPTCHEKGRAVKSVTIDALVREQQHPNDGWRFCRSATCSVAYYHPEGESIPVSGLHVRVGQKETSPDRPICYCFGYSAEAIKANPDRVSGDIKERCRRGEDRCAETNPQGSCCLGNVLSITRRLRSST